MVGDTRPSRLCGVVQDHRDAHRKQGKGLNHMIGLVFENYVDAVVYARKRQWQIWRDLRNTCWIVGPKRFTR